MSKERQPVVRTIPWQTVTAWTEVQLSIHHICSSLGGREEYVRSLGRRIQRGYEEIDGGMEILCADTCAGCDEVCCQTATVWYDLRDLLVLYLMEGVLPSGQITRKEDRSCIHLGENGCILRRTKRPFICTWYICPAQRGALRGPAATDSVRAVRFLIEDMQEARKELENACIDAVSGSNPAKNL